MGSGVFLSDEAVDLRLQLLKEQDKNLNLRLEIGRVKSDHNISFLDMEAKLNKALLGTMFWDVSSETTLLLLEKSLVGKRIISEEDFNNWESWKAEKRIKLALEDVNSEMT